jgi:hypothetical protein
MKHNFVFIGLAMGSFILGAGLMKFSEGIISPNLPVGITLTVIGFMLTAFSLYYNNHSKK